MRDWNRPYVPRMDARHAPLWVRPAIRVGGGSLSSWPVSVSGIDEPSGGTFYTDWVTLTGGPVADGLFALPNFTASTYPDGSVECWMEIGDSGTATATGIFIGKVTSTSTFADGLVERTGQGDVLAVLTGGALMGQVRWKVTGDAYLIWSLAGGSITQL